MHASLELAWMRLGFAVNDAATFTAEFRTNAEETTTCGVPAPAGEVVYGFWRGRLEHHATVDCPRCLIGIDRLMEGRTL